MWVIIISSEVHDCELYFKRTVILPCTAVYYAVQGGSNFLKCDHSNYSYCVAFPVILFMLYKVVLTFLLTNLMFSGKGLLDPCIKQQSAGFFNYIPS